jgi:hypothetical protein
MQAAMTLAAAPVAGRQQRLMSSRSAAPAGLAPLRGLRPRPVRRPAVAVRAQLEDALAAAADSAPSALDSLAAHLTTQLFFLGDAAEQLANSVGGSDAAQAVADAVNAVGDAPVQAAAEAAPKNSGFFGAFAGAFEAFLKVLDDGLEKLHVPYSYGFAIILLTVLVKLATYPLTAKQVESTLSMQSLQPRVKELQAKYAGDQERLQVRATGLVGQLVDASLLGYVTCCKGSTPANWGLTRCCSCDVGVWAVAEPGVAVHPSAERPVPTTPLPLPSSPLSTTG